MDFNFIGTIWSLLPPVVAIALALKTKEVYSSLFIGIVLGAILYSMSMGTGLEGFLTHLFNDTVGTGTDAKQYGLISCLSDPWNVGIIVFLVVLGSIVSLMNKAGGSAAFGRWASKHIKTKIGAQIATIILGLLIFIDDYFNCLTVGSVMRPITVRHGVTKEKLAYLIDSTAAPVCIISPISSWAAAVSGFVSGGENGLALFCQAIPFNFYAFFTIIFIFMIVLSGFDFKAMSKYDVRLQEWYERTGGQVDEVIDTKLQVVEHGVGAKQDSKKHASTNGSVADLVVPILMLIVFCMVGMVYSGGYFDATSTCYHNFVDAFAASNASVGLVIGSLAALILTIAMFVARRTLKFDNAMSCIIKGFPCHTDSYPCMDTEKYDRLSWSCRICIGRCGKHCLRTADVSTGNYIYRCSVACLCHRYLLGNIRHTYPYLYRRIPCCRTAPHHLHLCLHGRCCLRRPCVSDIRHHHHGFGRCRMQARSPCIIAVAIRHDSSHRVVPDIHRSWFHTATRHHCQCCHFLGFRHSIAFLCIMGAEKNQ
jgi:Na+/H+ antiporter NhaC